MGLFVFLFLCACILTFNLLVYSNIVGFPSSHVLMPYQSGLLYRRGHPVKAVGPGRHRVFVGIEKIIFLDMRPIQFNTENRAVILVDGVTVVYGFSASAKVSDVSKAMYASPAYNQLPAFVALCATRSILSAQSSIQLARGRASLEEEIIDTYKSRLDAVGFELVSYRLTQLSVVGASAAEG